MKNAASVKELCANEVEISKMLDALNPEHQPDMLLRNLGVFSRLDDLSKRLSVKTERAEASDILVEAARSLGTQSLASLVSNELDKFSRQSLYSSPVQTYAESEFKGFIAYVSDNLRISVFSITPILLHLKNGKDGTAEKGVTFSALDTAYVFLKGSAKLRLWKAKPFAQNDALEQRTLDEPSVISVADGDTLFCEGGADGMSIYSLDTPLLAIMATSLVPRARVNVHYSTATKKIATFTACEMSSARVQLLATLLRELGDGGSDAIIPLLDHPDHFVRWHLMRELLAMAPQKAAPELEKMVQDDPHPQVREVAAITLKMINDGELCQK